jgi:hypothetical protein
MRSFFFFIQNNEKLIALFKRNNQILYSIILINKLLQNYFLFFISVTELLYNILTAVPLFHFPPPFADE